MRSAHLTSCSGTSCSYSSSTGYQLCRLRAARCGRQPFRCVLTKKFALSCATETVFPCSFTISIEPPSPLSPINCQLPRRYLTHKLSSANAMSSEHDVRIAHEPQATVHVVPSYGCRLSSPFPRTLRRRQAVERDLDWEPDLKAPRTAPLRSKPSTYMPPPPPPPPSKPDVAVRSHSRNVSHSAGRERFP